MKSFNQLELPEALQHTLQHMNFTTPTPIQAQVIPHALQGKDILGSAQTGTGKTGAFGIPLVARLLSVPDSSALVLTPTRELATQVMAQLKTMLGKQSKIRTALLIGGESVPRQLQQLRNRPRLFVGTPGRINDHLDRGSLKLQKTSFFVMDETDRMLDMGFTVQIEKIIRFMPATRQTMLFSATMPNNIVKISEKYLNTNLVQVAVNDTSSPAKNIKHDMIKVNDGEKYPRLLSELEERSGSIILFMKTKYSTEKMAVKLSKIGHTADAIHGDLRQNKRDRVIANFRNQKFRILVATDVAARGLDIPHIEHVINYDLPQCAEDYIHRIGRTARAGAEGSAMCLVTSSDMSKWHAINRLLNPDDDHPKELKKQRGSRGRSKNARGSNANGKGRAPRGAKSGGAKSGGAKSGGNQSKSNKSHQSNGENSSEKFNPRNINKNKSGKSRGGNTSVKKGRTNNSGNKGQLFTKKPR